MSKKNFFNVVSKDNSRTIIEISSKISSIRLVSGEGRILTSNPITLELYDGDVVRINELFYIWVSKYENLEVQI